MGPLFIDTMNFVFTIYTNTFHEFQKISWIKQNYIKIMSVFEHFYEYITKWRCIQIWQRRIFPWWVINYMYCMYLPMKKSRMEIYLFYLCERWQKISKFVYDSADPVWLVYGACSIQVEGSFLIYYHSIYYLPTL